MNLDNGTCNIVAPFTSVVHAGVWYNEMVALLSTVDSMETFMLGEIKGSQMLSFCNDFDEFEGHWYRKGWGWSR